MKPVGRPRKYANDQIAYAIQQYENTKKSWKEIETEFHIPRQILQKERKKKS